MTKLYQQPFNKIVKDLKTLQGLTQFVETGTSNGSTVDWAKELFTKITTIEIVPETYYATKQRLSDTHINFLLGDSRIVLPTIDLTIPTLFWLDAHAGGGKFSLDDNCPLLDELEFITSFPAEHAMLIDDINAFCFPLAKPFDYTKWPTLNEIFDLIGSKYTIMIKNNVMIAVPHKYTVQVRQQLSLYE